MAELKREVKHGLFGYNIKVDNANVTTFTLASVDPVKDYVFRETNLQQDITMNQRLITGLEDPAAYLKAKNEDLAEIGNLLTPIFRGEYERQLKEGLTEIDARKKATNYLDSEKARLMRIHETKFPESVKNIAVQKLLKKN